ncbi:MAG: hypothetical protein KDA75_17485 [Planctomycetaceae bacterium]|nr:hypothetical protein [Planctomycetaceae bacterium]
MVCSLHGFVCDERGFVVSTELVLIATVCVLGLITALTCVRDAVNAELNDVAGAIGSLNQSYRFSGFHGCISPKCGVHAWTAGSAFGDLQDEDIRAIEGGAAVQPTPVQKAEPKPCPAPEPTPEPCPTTVPCPACETAAAVTAPCPCSSNTPVVEGRHGCGTPGWSTRVETDIRPIQVVPAQACPQPACGGCSGNAAVFSSRGLIW